VTDHSGDGGWDLIVAPWHLDEHIPAFPVPAGVAETIRPSLPAGPAPGRMTLLYQAFAGALGGRRTPV
jgi:arginase